MARYKVTGTWDTDRSFTMHDFYDDKKWTVIVEIADLLDTKTQTTYTAGSYRVRVEGPSPKPRAKTFTGESAWSSAERHADDVCREIERTILQATHREGV